MEIIIDQIEMRVDKDWFSRSFIGKLADWF